MKWICTLLIIFYAHLSFAAHHSTATDPLARKQERKRALQRQVKPVNSPFENEVKGNWGIAILVGAAVYLVAQHKNKK